MSAAGRLRVAVSVDPGRLADVRRAAADAGLDVEQELGEVGVLTGEVDPDRLEAVRAVDGVEAVEVERVVTLPPPDSPVQ